MTGAWRPREGPPFQASAGMEECEGRCGVGMGIEKMWTRTRIVQTCWVKIMCGNSVGDMRGHLQSTQRPVEDAP